MMFKVFLSFFVAGATFGILWPLGAVFLLFGTPLLMVLQGISVMHRWAKEDFKNATGVYTKFAAMLGWTHGHKVATGERSSNFLFMDGACLGAWAGFLTQYVVLKLLSSVEVPLK